MCFRKPNYEPLARAQIESGKMMAEAHVKAANIQRKTQTEVLNFYKDRIATLRADAAPYRELGLSAMEELQKRHEAGDFKAAEFKAPGFDDVGDDPGYQFRVAQGTKAIERSAAQRGGLFSGRTGAALQEFGQQSASQEYDKVYGRALQKYKIDNARKVQDYESLGGLARLGANVGMGLASQNTSLTGMAGTAMGAAGNAAAQGILGSANSLAAGNVGAASSRVQGDIARYNAQQQTFSNVLGVVGGGYGMGLFG